MEERAKDQLEVAIQIGLLAAVRSALSHYTPLRPDAIGRVWRQFEADLDELAGRITQEAERSLEKDG